MMEVGPALRATARPLFFCAEVVRSRRVAPVTTPADAAGNPSDDLLDFIALSLLPWGCRLHGAGAMRNGQPPAAVLEAMLAQHFRDQPGRGDELRQRAGAAVVDGRSAGLAPISWADASYPVALRTIFDPP